MSENDWRTLATIVIVVYVIISALQLVGTQIVSDTTYLYLTIAAIGFSISLLGQKH